MALYKNILNQAWKLTWRNKYLWWFGIFAALLGSGGELEILINNIGNDPGQALFPAWQKIASTGVFTWQTFGNIFYLLKNDTLNMLLVLLISLICLMILIFLVWLAMVSQAALVNNAATQLNQKKNSLSAGWQTGITNFWPVFTINVFVKAIIYILLVTFTLPVIFFRDSFSINLVYVLMLIFTFILALILSFIAKYAIAYTVINKHDTFLAIREGWLLFKNNWLVSLEMAVILFIISFLVGLAIILVILSLAVPFLFLGLIFHYSFSTFGAWIIAILALACFLMIVVGGGAALSVFQITSWTSLFLELGKKKVSSKLIRIVNSLVKTD